MPYPERMLEAGELIPDFELVDHDGNSVRSSDLAGHWTLLYWYPKADTPGCTAQAQGLRDQIEAFEDLDCVVYGASFDDPGDNSSFRGKYDLRFTLLSDRNHEVAVAFGVVPDADSSHARRVAHLIRPDGLVAVRYLVEDPEFFAESVLDDLERLTV